MTDAGELNPQPPSPKRRLDEDSLKSLRELLKRREQQLKELYMYEKLLTSNDKLLGFDPLADNQHLLDDASLAAYLEQHQIDERKLIFGDDVQMTDASEASKPPGTPALVPKQAEKQPPLPPQPQPTNKVYIKPPQANSGPPPVSVPYGLYALKLRYEKQPAHMYLQKAQQAVTTKDWLLLKREVDSKVILDRIETLKQENRWSLRQPKREKAPHRRKTHWDYLLDEMRWMALDFKEERRWKMASAYRMSKDIVKSIESRSDLKNTMDIDIEGRVTPFVLKPDPSNLPPLMSPTLINPHGELLTPIENFEKRIIDEEARALGIDELEYDSFTYETDAGKASQLFANFHGIYHALSDDPKHCVYVDPVYSLPVVPVNEIATRKYMSINRTEKPIARLLPDDRRYFQQPVKSQVSLFAPPVGSEMKGPGPHAPSQAKPASKSLTPVWTLEEDETLMKMAASCQFNWKLVCEFVNQTQFGMPCGPPRKLPHDCWSRWQHLQNKSGPSSRKDDMKRRAARHVHFFEGVMKIIKKRDQQKSAPAPAPKPPATGVNLNAHVSHQAIATRAGVDPRHWKTPTEHAERKWKLRSMANMIPGRAPPGQVDPQARPPLRTVGASGQPSMAPNAQSPQTGGQPRPPPAGRGMPVNAATAANIMSLTPAQLQQFMQQRPGMMRQVAGQRSGSPITSMQGAPPNTQAAVNMASLSALANLTQAPAFQMPLHQRQFLMQAFQQSGQLGQQRMMQQFRGSNPQINQAHAVQEAIRNQQMLAQSQLGSHQSLSGSTGSLNGAATQPAVSSPKAASSPKKESKAAKSPKTKKRAK